MNFYDVEQNYHGNNIFCNQDEQVISVSEMRDIEESIVSVIKTRQLVFLFCDNELIPMSAYVIFLRNRIVPVMLDSNIASELVENLIEKYRPDYLFVKTGRSNDFDGFVQVSSIQNYSILENKNGIEHHLYDDLALLLTTSGSTGSPKLVRQSYRNINSNAQAIAEYLGLNENERPITTLPLNYTYGISIINSHLLVGATILVTNKGLMEKEFWSFFKAGKATSFGGVPYTYTMLKKLRFFNMDLPYLKTMTQAGGKLTEELHKEFAEFAHRGEKKFIVMYGQTEATARMAYLPHEKAIEKIGSMGVAIPNGRFALIDMNGNEIIDSDVVGELVYYGENVTLGYAETYEDLAKADERNKILITGDMAKRDSDGYYYIVGRKKRFLKIFGNRVNLDEVDRMLNVKFPENEFACVGQDDLLEIFCAGNISSKNVLDFLAERTKINKSAFMFHEIENIPKNESGKVLYANLK